jgi:DNA-binding beta-propeller fold protein YncE
VLVLQLATGCAPSKVNPELVYFPSPPSLPRAVHLKAFNGLHELVPHRPSFTELFQGRTASPNVGTPAGMAFRDGVLYMADTDINAVWVWDLNNGHAERVGLRGKVPLVKPVAVAVDDTGTIYVADTGRNEVVSYDAAGHFARRYRPAHREDYRPVAVTVHDNKLYVADIHDHRVDMFSTYDGALVDSFGGVGSELGRFYFPMGLATDARGNIYISDMMNSRVQLFDAQHVPVSSMGQRGNRYGDMSKPRHLAAAPDGVIFIADVEFAHLHLFNDKGQLLMLIGGPEDRPGGTPAPVGVAIAAKLPESLASLVPQDFNPSYYLFVSNTTGSKRISLFAVGSKR